MEQVLLEVAVPIKVAAQRLTPLEQLALRTALRCGRGGPTTLGLVQPEAGRVAELQHGLHLGGEVPRGEGSLD